MAEIAIRVEGRAGRITLTRPTALNALSYAMCLAVDDALKAWQDDPQVVLVVIDAEGDRAFCAGGDIAQMYATGTAGDYAYGQRFWADEYRMNDRIGGYAKPVVTFLQGFTMGGGVGLGCHASHRIVGETAQVAMPECGIGLIPDVGGSRLLARAPGRLGAYLGTTGARMGPGDAIRSGFADHYLPEALWADMKSTLATTGDATLITKYARTPPHAPLADLQAEIDAHFAAPTLDAIVSGLAGSGSAFAKATLKALSHASPLAAACAIEMQRRLGPTASLRQALALEYRFTFRALQHSDFLEGIRAAIIDRDRRPHWRHGSAAEVTMAEITAMLAPLGGDELTFPKESP